MNLKEQRYVIALAKYQNISRAALELHLSQPALSTFLRKLERELGAELFQRCGRELRLTEAGRLYREKAEAMLQLDHEFHLALQQFLHNAWQSVRIGLQQLRSPRLAPRLEVLFQQELSCIHPIFIDDTGENLYGLLLKKKIDLLITSDVFPRRRSETQISSRVLRRDRILAVTSPDLKHSFFSRHKETLSFEDLRFLAETSLPFLVLQKGHSLRRITDRLFRSAKLRPRAIREASRQEAALHMASYGVGIAFTLDSYLSYFHLPGPIRCFSIPEAFSVPYCLLYRRGDFPSDLIQRLFSLLQSLFLDFV